MIPQARPLIEILAEIPDFRRNPGKRHPLGAILAMAGSAMLCGYRSYTAIAEWGRHYGEHLVRALGFTHRSPCAATLHTVLRRIDREALEAKLGAWAEGLLGETPRTEEVEDAVAIDGKTLRGSQTQGAPGAHLLSALAHRVGLTRAQQAVDDKTNEIPVALDLLHHLVLEGRIITMDALLTQRQIAQQIVAAKGDYVMVVKENQPQLLGTRKKKIIPILCYPPGEHTVEVIPCNSQTPSSRCLSIRPSPSRAVLVGCLWPVPSKSWALVANGARNVSLRGAA
jgi:hypothetical protein